MLKDILRAEMTGQDLQETDTGFVVCAMKRDGTLYGIGYVSLDLVLEHPDVARRMIEKIKFGKRQSNKPQTVIERGTP